MDNDVFEGYSGTYINDITFANDIMLIIVLLMLSFFAFLFRLNIPLYSKMIRNIRGGEQRYSIFLATEKDSFYFNAFMTFQTLLLCGILIFSFSVECGLLVPKTNSLNILQILGVLLLTLFIFFLFKKMFYAVFANIFTDKGASDILSYNQAAFCFWGIFLYIPVLWILLVGKYFFIAATLVIISYLIFRIFLLNRFFYIFFNKKTGLLFLSLYLCAQEIIPLVFLYKGLIYMYNIIEINNIWQ